MLETEHWMEATQRTRRQTGLDRHLAVYDGTGPRVACDRRLLLNFSSNDYLNLARHPDVVSRAAENLRCYGCGATASRLVVGSLACHEELEKRLAALKGYATALVFGSGHAANLGIVGSLVGRGDSVVIDRLAHASLVDAALLSRAEVRRFQHNDCVHLEQLLSRCPPGGRKLVVTESVFSMDGDIAPLADVASVAQRCGAMVLVDEAHATGVFGPEGAGCVRSTPSVAPVNFAMGTLSKALGGYGGFVACSELARCHLVNHARSFIYSTALPPVMAGCALGALDVLAREPERGTRLLTRAARLRARLKALGLDTGASASQIIPIVIGSNERVLRVHRRLLAKGLLAVPIRPPTVPQGTARLRLSVTLGHTDEDVDWAAEQIGLALQEEGGP